MEPISLGLTALRVGSGIFGMFNRGGKVDPALAQQSNAIEWNNSLLAEQRMHLDAQRRKRDIIRQAQVATASAENTAANAGAINSSGIEGARAGISGQAGVNTLGVSQNEAIASEMFQNNRMQGLLNYQMQGQKAQKPNYGAMASNLISSNQDELGRLIKWGYNFGR